MNLENKLEKLKTIIEGYEQILVAFSGGVDSTFLLAFAYETFMEKQKVGGRPAADCVAALTATGSQFIKSEADYAEALCDRMGIAHKRVDMSHVIGMIKRNPVDRCYHCKREMFGELMERARMTGSVLCDGTNADDSDDYRPGYRAAAELGVASPLKEAGLTKDEIRKAMESIEWVRDKAEYPAFACLASRIPYGETISEGKLEAIAKAEAYLKGKGFSRYRVRCHEIAGKVSGNEQKFLAIIEVDRSDRPGVVEIMDEIESAVKACGFETVALDLGGYEMGKMNRLAATLKEPDRIRVEEKVERGNAENVTNEAVMKEIDRFLREVTEKEYSFGDFVDIIEKLRMPDGCPWDRAQTHESLKKHMVEEANEALEAIDDGDWQHLCEELGDVLLQIVLHAQIASEAGEFSIDDVVQCVSEKMIRRHPHVFGNIDISGIDEGLDLWEEIKKREKMAKRTPDTKNNTEGKKENNA